METSPKAVYGEYVKGVNFKSSFGKRGMYEQTKINTRFFNGEQWYGISSLSDRPLVCHNLIKRIGNYKNAKLSGEETKVNYGIKGETEKAENGTAVKILNGQYEKTAERLRLNEYIEDILRLSFISGSGVLYVYWDENENTGFYADEKHTLNICGDIALETLNIENVYFADVYEQDVQKQPYIIVAANKSNKFISETAKAYGGDAKLFALPENEKSLTLTKFFISPKDKKVHAVTVTEKCTVRPEWNLGLNRYPLALFKRDGNTFIYGESEITNLIPNQIAVNRMLTASVWATMSMGMPIMAVNGDTVTEEITNDPGQIIRIYGENEDVANAIRFITPPDFSENFRKTIEMLTNCTLASASVSSAALGEYNYSNAAAITALQTSVDESMNSLRNRFLRFKSDIALIFADFFINKYGVRKLKLPYGTVDFNTKNYDGLIVTADVKTEEKDEIL